MTTKPKHLKCCAEHSALTRANGTLPFNMCPLSAAAPELLEMLKRIHAELETAKIAWSICPELALCRRDIFNLIARAEGA